MSRKRTISIFATLLFTIGLFVLAGYYTQQYLPELQDLIGGRPLLGMAVYFALAVLAIVLAPFSSLPLLPVVANVWGPFLAAVLSITAWTTGAVLAFWVSQKYGQPVVKRFVSLKKVRELEALMPRKNIFWGIILLRVGVPIDLVSYALGLFTQIRPSTFFWATFFGMIPGAFLLSYLGTVPVLYQVGALTMILVVFFTFLKYIRPKWWEVLTR